MSHKSDRAFATEPCAFPRGSMVQDQLKNVKRIYPGARAFAALLEDDSVVSWGDPENGRFADLSACVFFLNALEPLYIHNFTYGMPGLRVEMWAIVDFKIAFFIVMSTYDFTTISTMISSMV